MANQIKGKIREGGELQNSRSRRKLLKNKGDRFNIPNLNLEAGGQLSNNEESVRISVTQGTASFQRINDINDDILKSRESTPRISIG